MSGAIVSTVTVTGALGVAFPAASVAVTIMVCGLSLSAEPFGRVNVQLPLASTVACCGAPPSIDTVIVLPISVFPLMVGVLSLVYSVPFTRVLLEMLSICGVVGATVSTVMV
ncbi:hypothetical protein D3C71_1613850 [compost metagenome]